MAKKVTNEMIKKKLYDTVGDEYTLVSDYVKGTVKVDLLHAICGDIYRVTPNHFFYDNSRCKCQLNIKQPKVFEEEFNEISKGSYTQMGTYERKDIKIDIKHNVCGTIFPATPHSFLQGKGCPECFGNKTKTTEEFSKEVDELTDGEFSLMTDYVNNRTHVTIKHIECGKEYPVTPKDFLRGNRCPFCKQSKGERLVRRILDEANVEYTIQKSYNDLKSNYQKLPFDFFLPEHNLLIEYDGEQHFKEVQFFGGAKKLESQTRRDTLKNEYAKRNNIRLLRIPYTYSEEKVKEVIISYL
ncbi:hypothetical protein BCP8-2_036 [Bacillus phage BCP8-2]|uniref:Homing endonuclease n=1 Tax=Bacillus phage BCP8-2 TaxID=1129192 RepID=A0A0E3D988_9CAUD|nr:HNH endonuclease [Bacillus phage BCP8-2]AHJ87074.1 hypothetical protein BCP8-2_036 [Bacillus phage BCP8-2]